MDVIRESVDVQTEGEAAVGREWEDEMREQGDVVREREVVVRKWEDVVRGCKD